MSKSYEDHKNMESCYIIIPKKGIPYLTSETSNNIFDNFECECECSYDMGSKNIGIVCPNHRLRVIVYTNMNDVRDNEPSNAVIYESDDIDRKSYSGIDRETSEKILENLKSREWVLWNKPPKSKYLEKSKLYTERKRHSET
jgi:hypothetical protein